MKIEILYFEGCPNMPLALGRVGEALDETEVRAEVHVLLMRNRLEFGGSPTVLADGHDVCSAAAPTPIVRPTS
jgi:hypothetical protein